MAGDHRAGSALASKGARGASTAHFDAGSPYTSQSSIPTYPSAHCGFTGPSEPDQTRRCLAAKDVWLAGQQVPRTAAVRAGDAIVAVLEATTRDLAAARGN